MTLMRNKRQEKQMNKMWKKREICKQKLQLKNRKK